MQSVHHLCERCLRKGIMTPAEIVHHKIELTPENSDDPLITLNTDNLEAVCRECHAQVHEYYQSKKRYKILEGGRVVSREFLEKNKFSDPPC